MVYTMDGQEMYDAFKIEIKMVWIFILKEDLVWMFFPPLLWHKVLNVCSNGGHFYPAEGLCLQKEDEEMSGLFEKQMFSLMELMKLLYCLFFCSSHIVRTKKTADVLEKSVICPPGQFVLCCNTEKS